MSVEPGSLRTAVERIPAPDSIRRVERDKSGQEFGQKNRDARQNGKHFPGEAADPETPQDVVDLSGDYHHEGTALPVPVVPPLEPSTLKRAGTPASIRTLRPAPNPPPERHIDIQV